jgi:hypothetical protein
VKRFPLFAECLTAGVLVVLTALPLVTLLPALAAGCAHVRAHVDGETTAVRAYFTRVRTAVRGGLGASIGVVAAFAVLTADLVVLRRTGLRGGGAVAAVCTVVAVGLAVVVLRAAATWSPGDRWSALVRGSARRALADPTGSLLLGMALGVLVVVTWQLPPLVVPMLGCVLMAAVAVERRAARPSDSGR